MEPIDAGQETKYKVGPVPGEDYRGLGCVIPLVGVIVIVVIALFLNVVDTRARGAFCDIVGGSTPISEGLDISEYDPVTRQWKGLPPGIFEGQPYLQLVGPDDGTYVIFKGIGGGLVVAPFVDMEVSIDGWQHHTCGYLITWNP